MCAAAAFCMFVGWFMVHNGITLPDGRTIIQMTEI